MDKTRTTEVNLNATIVTVFQKNLRSYLDLLITKGYSKLTLATFEFAINEFIQFKNESSLKSEAGTIESQISEFIKWKLKARRSFKYHPSYKSRIKQNLFEFKKLIDGNDFDRRKLYEKDIEILTAYFVRTIPKQYDKNEATSKIYNFCYFVNGSLSLCSDDITDENISQFVNHLEKKFYNKKLVYRSDYDRSVLKSPIIKYCKYLEENSQILFSKEYEIIKTHFLTEEIKTYMLFCADARGMVKTSLHRVNWVLEKFAASILRQKITDIKKIKITHVDQHIAEENIQRTGTLLTHISILRRFLKWLYIKNKSDIDISILLVGKRAYIDSKVPRYLSASELEKVMDFDAITTRKSKELISITVSLLFYTGMRLGEAVKLDLNDINISQRFIVLKNRKNKNDLILPICDQLYEQILKYIAKRPVKHNSSRLLVGVMTPIGDVTPRGLSFLLRRHFHRCGVSGGAHRIRHTFAQRLLATGSSVEEVGQLLGHGSLQSPKIYLKTSMDRMRKYVVKNELY